MEFKYRVISIEEVGRYRKEKPVTPLWDVNFELAGERDEDGSPGDLTVRVSDPKQYELGETYTVTIE